MSRRLVRFACPGRLKAVSSPAPHDGHNRRGTEPSSCRGQRGAQAAFEVFLLAAPRTTLGVAAAVASYLLLLMQHHSSAHWCHHNRASACHTRRETSRRRRLPGRS
eukprot:4554008-Prymnesium_polylepis.2